MATVSMTAVVMMLVIMLVILRRTRPTERDIAWLAGPTASVQVTTVDTDVHEVCHRYLSRHRQHRLVGTMFGVGFAVVIGIRWFESVSFGIGGAGPLADMLFCGIAGGIMGTLSAESFRLSPVRNRHQVASLAPRSTPTGRPIVHLSRGVAAVAAVVAVMSLVIGHGASPLVVGLVIALPLMGAEVTLRVISDRTRPIMTEPAARVDSRLRAFASSTVSHLHLTASLLMLGWVCSKVDDLGGALGIVRSLFVVACAISALVMLRRGAPRPRLQVVFDREGAVAW